MTDNEKIAKWLYNGTAIEGASGIPFDEKYEFWHGPEGILAEIEKRGESTMSDFGYALIDQYPEELPGAVAREEIGLTVFYSASATPAQLSATLVSVIEGREEPTDSEWKCPVCGSDETWFDRSVSYCGGVEEGPTTRCAGCGIDVDEARNHLATN